MIDQYVCRRVGEDFSIQLTLFMNKPQMTMDVNMSDQFESKRMAFSRGLFYEMLN